MVAEGTLRLRVHIPDSVTRIPQDRCHRTGPLGEISSLGGSGLRTPPPREFTSVPNAMAWAPPLGQKPRACAHIARQISTFKPVLAQYCTVLYTARLAQMCTKIVCTYKTERYVSVSDMYTFTLQISCQVNALQVCIYVHTVRVHVCEQIGF